MDAFVKGFLIKCKRRGPKLLVPLVPLGIGAYCHWHYVPNDDIRFVLPILGVPILHLFFGLRLPSSVHLSKIFEYISLISLTVIGLCWIWFSFFRAVQGTFPEQAAPIVQRISNALSVTALSSSVAVVLGVWILIIRWVHPKLNSTNEDAASVPNGSPRHELKEYPVYTLTLLFAALFQVICSLSFALALHDLPGGKGLRSSQETVEVGFILFDNATSEIDTEASLATVQKLHNLVRQWSSDRSTRPLLTLQVPPTFTFDSSDSWDRINRAIQYIEYDIGNYLMDIRVSYAVYPLLANPQPFSPSVGSSADLSGVEVLATHVYQPQLLDFLYFMTSTLVTTGYCDLIPISGYAKFLCTVANIYEVFFTVVFFGITVSLLLGGAPIQLSANDDADP